jgi:hypothetical protein
VLLQGLYAAHDVLCTRCAHDVLCTMSFLGTFWCYIGLKIGAWGHATSKPSIRICYSESLIDVPFFLSMLVLRRVLEASCPLFRSCLMLGSTWLTHREPSHSKLPTSE